MLVTLSENFKKHLEKTQRMQRVNRGDDDYLVTEIRILEGIQKLFADGPRTVIGVWATTFKGVFYAILDGGIDTVHMDCIAPISDSKLYFK